MLSLQFLVTALVVVLAPGTGVTCTLAVGLGQGRRAAVMAAAGCTFGILPHLAAATLGLAAVLHSSALLFQMVKFAGVAYLLWLAWQALKSGGALAVFILYGLFAAQARSLVLGNARLMRWLNRGFAAVFAALAGRLAMERA